MNENTNPLVAELTARANGTPAADAVAAARAGSRGLGDLPGRTAITIAASVLAVVAIAATSWGLSRHDGKESAAPNAPESSDITFGPNQPDATPTALPTLPEASTPGYPSNDPYTTPTFPTASGPSLPSYTTPGYSYPTSTTSYSPSTSTSSPTTTPRPTSSISPPAPTQVRPVAPTATPIRGRCGTYGSLRVAQTNGVRYLLTLGNGREGRWEVEAHARRGYAIVSGATTRWDGNLGRFKKCPTTIRDVTTAATSAPENWQVTVRLTVPTTERRALSVAYSFHTEVTVVMYGGADWTCTGPGGADLDDGPVAADSPITCKFGERGAKPPPVFLIVQATAPSGTVSLFAGGKAIDIKSFG